MTFKKTAEHRSILLVVPLLVLVCCCRPAHAASDQEAGDAYRAGILLELNTIKQALPAPPQGWVVQDETKINEAIPRHAAPGTTHPVLYRIRYKRVAGVREEQRKLDNAYEESARRNNEAARPQIEELIRQQTRVSLALRKSARRRNAAEQKRMNDELDENGRRMHALHEETDRKIGLDVEPFLVKDAEAVITVALNEVTAEFSAAGLPFESRHAAFGLRKDGERSGVTLWKEGEILLLYGAWQQSGPNRFRGTVRQDQPAARAQTIRITVTGEQKRAERLLKDLDVKSILSLMH